MAVLSFQVNVIRIKSKNRASLRLYVRSDKIHFLSQTKTKAQVDRLPVTKPCKLLTFGITEVIMLSFAIVSQIYRFAVPPGFRTGSLKEIPCWMSRESPEKNQCPRAAQCVPTGRRCSSYRASPAERRHNLKVKNSFNSRHNYNLFERFVYDILHGTYSLWSKPKKTPQF